MPSTKYKKMKKLNAAEEAQVAKNQLDRYVISRYNCHL